MALAHTQCMPMHSVRVSSQTHSSSASLALEVAQTHLRFSSFTHTIHTCLPGQNSTGTHAHTPHHSLRQWSIPSYTYALHDGMARLLITLTFIPCLVVPVTA